VVTNSAQLGATTVVQDLLSIVLYFAVAKAVLGV